MALPAQGGGSTARSLFDGETLAGWRGDQRLWTVEDGAIKGSTLDHKIDSNTFLIWEGGEVEDFELRFEAKFTPANNSGVQYRSRPLDSNPYGVAGNQFDLHPSPNYLAMLYGERERGIVAQRGQQVVVGENGKSKVVGATNPTTPIDVSQWHDYRIVARGNHLIHEVDGVVAVDITDNDPKARRSGVIALQLHQGAPMNVWFRNLELTAFAPDGAEVSAAPAAAGTPDEPETAPHWIWSGASDGERASFRHAFEVSGDVALASLHTAADNHCEVWLNGKRVLKNDDWAGPSRADVKDALRAGRNQLAVHAWNDGGPAALALRLWIRGSDEQDTVVVSDGSWRAIAAQGADGWRDGSFDDSSWGTATDLGEVGSSGLPWSGSVGATSFGARPTPPKPQTVRDAEIQTLPGFVAELVYEVPRDSQGSWVSLGTLPDGSLIASDQADKGLFRIRPAAVGVPGATTSVTRIPVEIGGAQGLLWAFDSLYVMVNGRGSGLYRITDQDGDGELDDVKLLRKLEGAGEHGPHAVRLSPDGEALVVCAGNHTNPPEFDGSRIPTNWGEDLLLPRQWDARGHARGRMAPGGWIARVSPDGEHWEMLSVGYRNEYDFAFDRSGEMFAYDADMEWDMGMPWYRPTRISHATSGSEFGWRSGTGKWPTDYPDSLPPLLEIGPGSPTGLTFGYGARFPARYEQALYACDWTFGTIWAVHLEPDGATYRATSEEFASGKPLALTDVVVGADGAMYLTVGGRGTQSKLYRIRHESAQAGPAGPALALTTPEATLRKQLEAFHGKADPKAVDTAWPALGHQDRFVAYAARIALESQTVAEWRERAIAETDPAIASNAMLALARQGSGAEDRDAVLRKLMGLRGPFGGEFGVISRLRTAGVAMARHGMPDEQLRQQMIELLSNNLRPRNKRIFVEMVKLLAYLGAPTVVEQAMPMLVAAEPSPAPAWSELIQRNDGYGGPIAKMLADMPPLEGIDLAFALRNVRYGWTLPLRRQYFEFINRAAKHPGGASYAGFLTNCRNEALENCSFFERAACADLTGEELAAKPDFEITPPQGPGRAWTIDAAVEAIEAGQGPRDFAAGRNLFHAVACVACHRFDGAGGDIGPDLTTVANKFSTRDLLTSIVEPSQVISDQYGSSIVTRRNGTEVFGRVNEKDGGDLEVYPMDPKADPVLIPAADVAAVKASPISQMPQGLINSLNADELRDLIAYLMSRGDENAPAYRR